MIWMRRGLFAGSVAIALGLGCSSEVQDTGAGGAGGTSAGGKGGTGTGGAGASEACWPTDPICYSTSIGKGSPGTECLAMRDNTTQDHVQMRQTWFKSIAPKGNTIDIIYKTLKDRSELPLAQCNMSTGTTGYLQLTDWDRTNKTDITQQTIRNGYATFTPNTATDVQNAITNGLCMAELTYDDPAHAYATPLDPSLGMSLPFHAAPTVAKRVDKPFSVSPPDANFLAYKASIAPGGGIAYVDDANHTIHGYAPLAWVVIWDSATSKIVIPAHEGDTWNRFNDSNYNCVGRYRGDVMSPSSSPPCDSLQDQTNPPWGCMTDGTTPTTPAGGDVTNRSTCAPGDGPSTINAFFLITELEQVFSSVLNSTLCVSYQTFEQATTDAWAKDPASGGWGNNCRGATYTDATGTHPRWNPSSPNGPDGIAKTADDGIPYGDWCSTNNQPSTDQCHDAYLSKSTGSGAAIKVQTTNCQVQ